MSRKKDGTYADDILNDLLGEDSRDAAASNDDHTIQLSDEELSLSFNEDKTHQVDAAAPSVYESKAETFAAKSHQTESISDKVRTSVSRMFSGQKLSRNPSPTELKLAQSESIRIAQERILELEQLLQTLRSENEQLVAAGETLQRRADELMSKQESTMSKLRDQKQFFEDERKILQEALNAKDRDIAKLRQKNDEVEARLAANMQKIRIREKELENRLELIKMESSALIQNKNEMILDLKKNIDQLNIELENYRSQGHRLNQQIDQKHEMLRRTVRTLRIALTMLEGDDESKDEAS